MQLFNLFDSILQIQPVTLPVSFPLITPMINQLTFSWEIFTSCRILSCTKNTPIIMNEETARENVVSSIKKHVNDLIFRDTCEGVCSFVSISSIFIHTHTHTHYEPKCNMFFLNSLFSASPYKQDVFKRNYKLRTFRIFSIIELF